MAEEKVFPEGIRVFGPHSSAPDFVKGSIVITMRDLVDFVNKNPSYLQDYNGKKQLKLQLLEGRDGKMYTQVDTWKKGDAPAKAATGPVSSNKPIVINSVDDNSLPF